MAVSHVKSNAVGDWTGTVTVFNSQGSTATVAATDLVRPVDWNSGHNQFYTLTGNTNNASTVSGTNVVFEGLGGVTLRGSNNSVLGVSAENHVTHSRFYPFAFNVMSNANRQASLLIQPHSMPNLHHDRVGLLINFTNNTNSTGSVTISVWAGLYTKNDSTLSLLASTSTSRGHTFSGSVGDFSLQAGARQITIPWTRTITQGDYWWGFVYRTTTGGANASVSGWVASASATTYSGIMGEASNASKQHYLGLGAYSATTSGMPDSIAFSQIVGSHSGDNRPHIFMLRNGTV